MEIFGETTITGTKETLVWSNYNQNRWFGVKCDFNGNITGLFLKNNNLDGIIDSSFNALVFLRELDLSSDHSSQTKNTLRRAQTDFSVMTQLEFVSLKKVNLLKQVSEFKFSPSLAYCDISRNRINGGIGTTFSALNKLKYLSLAFNQLSSTIENSTFGDSLEQLEIQSNQISGNLPDLSANKETLKIFDFSNNNLGPSLSVFP